MKRLPRWRGWHYELTARAIRLLIIAGLLAIGAVSNGFTPSMQLAIVDDEPMLVQGDSARSDSIMRMVGIPPEVRASAIARRSYRRSSQVQLAINELRERDLLLPLPELSPRTLQDSFDDVRGGGARRHRAVDIHAPRGTPILSVDEGRIVKLHTSRDGGISVYATDPRARFIYFYAHLDAYHPNLSEGMPLARGDTLGYVGTTGNAPADAPHLHFQILRASNIARWSGGTPINPVQVFRP